MGKRRRDLNVLDAARLVVDDVNRIIDAPGARILHVGQMREALQSIGSNIREGFGRGDGPDRAYFIRVSRSSAEESREHLRTNYAAQRVSPRDYWRNENRLCCVVKMIDNLIETL